MPIARYLCRKKGHLQHPHKTFSLLPAQLIPYRKHDLDLVVETLHCQHQQNLSPAQTIEAISSKGQNDIIDLSYQQLHRFNQIFHLAWDKLMTNSDLKPLLLQNLSSPNPIICLLVLIQHYQPSPSSLQLLTSLPVKLSLDFFFSYQHDHLPLRHFLFGTPSQKRLYSSDA
ncbi:MAG: hypothetical protein AB1414_13625 [bacterium]